MLDIPEGINFSKGCVYLARVEGMPFFKIGYTRNCPRQRVATLQTGCPLPISLESVWFHDSTNMKDLERNLHQDFAEYRLRGEWFKFTASTLREVFRKARNAPSSHWWCREISDYPREPSPNSLNWLDRPRLNDWRVIYFR